MRFIEDAASPAAVAAADGREARAEAVRLRGEWGETVAAGFLARKGMRIVGRRVRPCMRDRRCEIDLIARDSGGAVVFVEVKAHKERSPIASRLWRVDRRKKVNILRACTSWIMSRNWRGPFRFDVVEVYGTGAPGTVPEVDHMVNVPLFPAKWRFW